MSQRPSRQACIDRQVFDLARSFLLKFDHITPEVLDRHLSVPDTDRPKELPGIFLNLISSAQNRHSLPKVIGLAIGGVENLSDILCDFEPGGVVEKYAEGGAERLLDDIVQQLMSGSPPRREARSHWPAYCRSVLSGAAFLARFRDGEDFHAWAAFFDRDDRARPALPALLSHEIRGFGFALACDFLKELGYHNFGKPDVHLKVIFSELGLAESDDPYTVFKAITRLAINAGVTPYAADKVFWLISTGRFYHDNIDIGRHRGEFIAYAAAELARERDGNGADSVGK
jgi:hypothetical protein